MILVVGSTNLDQTGQVPHLPRPGETVLGGRFASAPGGKGANQALAARRAGGDVCFHSAVGADAYADAALALLRQDGVDLDGVTTGTAATGVALILVDPAGENVIAVLPGANAEVDEAHVAAAFARPGAGILLLQQEVAASTNRAALTRARASGLRSILNIAPFQPETAEIAPLADILVANETEIGALTGIGTDLSGLDAAILDWADRHGQVVIVTLGAEGACIAHDGRVTRLPASKVEVVDTVGAGDTFCGYLAAGLDAGAALEDAVRLGLGAASRACTGHGAQPAIPYRADLA